jgi:hypothetical protein
MLKFSVTIELDEEQLQDLFENLEIKFSKAKITKLKKMISEVEPDLQEQLEATFEEFISDLITDEWER